MLNPIAILQKIYQLDPTAEQGIAREIIEQHESELGIQLPPMLYHYLLELGQADFNTAYHHFVELPFERLGEHIVIGKTCDDDGVWGIHQDDLNPKKQPPNPMVQMSRNFDAISSEFGEVHWFDELPLAEFLLAQAIVNGVNGGLNHHAQIYDFAGDTIPHDLGEKLANLTQEITELHRPHERFFQMDDFGVVMMLAVDENKPTAFLMGSDNAENFDRVIKALALGFDT